jgi:hypothetical protein
MVLRFYYVLGSYSSFGLVHMARILISYAITPMGAVRMNKADAWRKRDCVLRYFSFKDEVKLKNVTVLNGDSISFFYPCRLAGQKRKKP